MTPKLSPSIILNEYKPQEEVLQEYNSFTSIENKLFDRLVKKYFNNNKKEHQAYLNRDYGNWNKDDGERYLIKMQEADKEFKENFKSYISKDKFKEFSIGDLPAELATDFSSEYFEEFIPDMKEIFLKKTPAPVLIKTKTKKP